MRIVREYGCVLCQRYHREDVEPALFAAHLFHQSKHGVRDVALPDRPAPPATLNDLAARWLGMRAWAGMAMRARG